MVKSTVPTLPKASKFFLFNDKLDQKYVFTPLPDGTVDVEKWSRGWLKSKLAVPKLDARETWRTVKAMGFVRW